MKTIVILAILTLSPQIFAEQVTCRANRGIQVGEANLKADAEISFELNRIVKTLTNIAGHVFVRSPYSQNEEINTENSYMGFFKSDLLVANPRYHPNKYKGYAQFKDFDAIHTVGQEDGMWGTLVINLADNTSEFDINYIFQAGDHMGGTVFFKCTAR